MWRRLLIQALVAVVLLVGVRAGWQWTRPARPFYGRWGYGGYVPGWEFRRGGVLLIHMCVGAERGRWEEASPGVLKIHWGGETSFVRWRVSAGGKTLLLRNREDGRTWTDEQTYPRTGGEVFALL